MSQLVTQGKPAQKKRGRPAARDAEQTRLAILNAARKCFADVGFAAATNSEIAKKAGVTASALYNHFESKSDLYIAVCVQVEGEITRFHEQAVADAKNSRDALLDVIDGSIELYEEDPTLATFGSKVSMEVVSHPELAWPVAEKIKGGVEKILVAVLEEGKKRGEISGDISSQDIANMYISSAMGMAQASLLLGKEYYISSMKTLRALILNSVFTDQQ